MYLHGLFGVSQSIGAFLNAGFFCARAELNCHEVSDV